MQQFASGDTSQSPSLAARTLFAIRWKVGELLGWDDDADLDSEAPTLRDRLPVDLRDAASGPDFAALPFSSLYLLDDEFEAVRRFSSATETDTRLTRLGRLRLTLHGGSRTARQIHELHYEAGT